MQFAGLRAQKYDKERFDGQSVYGSLLNFELIYHAYSTIAILEDAKIREVATFDMMKPGCESYRKFL